MPVPMLVSPDPARPRGDLARSARHVLSQVLAAASVSLSSLRPRLRHCSSVRPEAASVCLLCLFSLHSFLTKAVTPSSSLLSFSSFST